MTEEDRCNELELIEERIREEDGKIRALRFGLQWRKARTEGIRQELTMLEAMKATIDDHPADFSEVGYDC